jgi:molecular chaperone DnaK
MNVSAKDKSSGKATSITIRSSGGLSDSDIDRMVKEAEAARETDKIRRELIDVKNEADSMVYNTEK